MNVDGTHYTSIWLEQGNPRIVHVIDQRFLPHDFVVENITSLDEMAVAIKEMHVRGAPLIGAAAAFGIYLASFECSDAELSEDPSVFDAHIKKAADVLRSTRPTAIDLSRAVSLQLAAMRDVIGIENKRNALLANALALVEDSTEMCRKIGEHGLKIIEDLSRKKKGDVVNILTHCNAGWLGCIDYGTATSPIYAAFDIGIKVHVWVDETRPRNQGAKLTAWELGKHGVPYTVIADNTGGHLMQHGMVDMVIVGTDRTTRNGDVANKIGTYLKALAAKDNNVPFYVALPSSTIDWTIRDGLKEIPIEERGEDEVVYMDGFCEDSKMIKRVLVSPAASRAANYGFDVTPARLVTGLITERGICRAAEEDLLRLFPEKDDIANINIKHKPKESYTKFNCDWINDKPIAEKLLVDIDKSRDLLYSAGLIGAYTDGPDKGIGFGNISKRIVGTDNFIITGTATGNFPILKPEHYTSVVEFDIDKNSLTCRGPVQASSESLTHAAVYLSDKSITSVVHVHNHQLWAKLKDKMPTTSPDAEYGTPEIANEIIRLFREQKTELMKHKIIVMAGHEDGIISFGTTVEESTQIIMALVNNIRCY